MCNNLNMSERNIYSQFIAKKLNNPRPSGEFDKPAPVGVKLGMSEPARNEAVVKRITLETALKQIEQLGVEKSELLKIKITMERVIPADLVHSAFIAMGERAAIKPKTEAALPVFEPSGSGEVRKRIGKSTGAITQRLAKAKAQFDR